MTYEVQTQMLDTWENCWTVGENLDQPATYPTLDAAIDAIRDHITDCIEAVECGDMQDSPDPSEFRIVGFDETFEYNNGTWEKI